MVAAIYILFIRYEDSDIKGIKSLSNNSEFSDAMTPKILFYGYDTPESAHAAIHILAEENNCKEDYLCVYQIIEKES